MDGVLNCWHRLSFGKCWMPNGQSLTRYTRKYMQEQNDTLARGGHPWDGSTKRRRDKRKRKRDNRWCTDDGCGRTIENASTWFYFHFFIFADVYYYPPAVPLKQKNEEKGHTASAIKLSNQFDQHFSNSSCTTLYALSKKRAAYVFFVFVFITHSTSSRPSARIKAKEKQPPIRPFLSECSPGVFSVPSLRTE